MPSLPSVPEPPGPTRRRFIAGALALLAGGAGAILAACSGPDRSATPVPSATALPQTAAPPSPSTAGPTPEPTQSAAALRRRIGRMLMVGFRGTTFDAADPVLAAIAAGELGGTILFDRDHLTKTAGRNVTSPAQLAALTRALHAAAPAEAGAAFVVAIDQEGGLVSRLNPTDGYPATESEAQLGATNDLARTTVVATATATALRDAGIDLNLAPVVDLDVDPTSPAIGALRRSYSSDPAVVIAHAGATIDAHHALGVRCAIKHFPGEGSSRGNTDLGIVDVTETWTAAELAPFRALVDRGLPDAVMVGNIIDAHLDAKLPLSLSPKAVDGLLRTDLGWDGVVVTDDLQAGAIRAQYGVEDAAVRAILAGADLLLFANQQVYDPGIGPRVIDAVVAAIASGRLTADRIQTSVDRLDRMLAGGH